ncbi:MAG: Na/Pi cotransporter family protein [Clostridiales bacterium]|jgi:phosphate:Na+ symporter|nr:Na/Pi cotransporter family protein [Clostridiales bacterium]
MNGVVTALLGLCSGMAIFLYSIKMMSGSLEVVAGDKMKTVLGKLTGNRFLGVAIGAGVTALIQSSTATTVMVIGFVNAGLMDLYQALWIIMGANIGTNITSQLIAFKIGDYAAILALIGVLMCLIVKNKKMRGISEVVAALGFIFVSMNLMTSSMDPLSELDIVKDMFINLKNPILEILVGVLFVIIFQSSAGGLGVLQALVMSSAGADLISLEQAMFIIFGLNIGTCLHAVIAAVGGSRNAMRAALMHLLFNVIGTVVFSIAAFIFPVAGLVRSLSPDDVARQFANMHLVFNLVSTALLLPCGGLIVKLVNVILPDKGGDAEGVRYLKYLNPNMLSPNLSIGVQALIKALANEIGRMLVMAGGNVQKSFAAVLDNNEDIQNEINQTEEYIDYLNKEISFYISHIMVFDLEEEDALTMSALFKITGNIERMGDHATNIAGYANLLEDKGLRLSDKAQAEVREMMKITEEAYATLIGTKPNSVHIRMAQIEQKIDDMTDDYREHQLERLKSGVCSGEACVVYSEMLTDFERLGDHMLNVAEAAAESNVKSFGIEAVKVKAEPAESTATA